MRPKSEKREIVVSFRLDLDSEEGQIYEKYTRQGYERADIMRAALLNIDGVLPKRDSIDAVTLEQLQRAISRLEGIAQSMQQGVPMTPQQQEEVTEALNPQFIQAIKQHARPAFRMKR